MKNISISFIIPYYKVDVKLLDRCLNSLLQFDHIGLDWEAHIIDDGTPNSMAENIVQQKGSNRLFYHRHVHSGLGKTRNAGMVYAQKEYIHFLDADDYLYLNACEKLFSIMVEEKPQLITFNYHKEYNDIINQRIRPTGKIRWKGTGVDYMTKHNLHGSACCYFVQKSILTDIQFSDIAYHEDEEFTPLLFLKAEDIIITDIEAYAYYQRQGSLLHEKATILMSQRYASLLTILNRLKTISGSMKVPYSTALSKRVDMLCMDMIYNLLLNSPNKDFFIQTLKEMHENGFYPIRFKPHTLTYILFSILVANKQLAVILYKIFQRIKN